jgi:branched-chain amino acid transport system permease protein
MVMCALLGIFITRTDTGRAIRAVAKERMGARLVGIDVDKVFERNIGLFFNERFYHHSQLALGAAKSR